MWLLLAFCSAALLGFYDVFKKKSLNGNAVLPVLALNTLFSSLIFIPFILVSRFCPSALQDTIFFVPETGGWEVHKYIVLKSVIVLSSWTFGYFGMKHLPLTIVGPINATRPVMTLVGALLIFGERLNLYQWIGVLLAVVSFFMLSRSGKKEGISFEHNRWVWFVVLAALLGAISGLYDKYLMGMFNNMVVQAWYNIYQLFMMGAVLMFLWLPKRKTTTPFHWDWCIPSCRWCGGEAWWYRSSSVPWCSAKRTCGARRSISHWCFSACSSCIWGAGRILFIGKFKRQALHTSV